MPIPVGPWEEIAESSGILNEVLPEPCVMEYRDNWTGGVFLPTGQLEVETVTMFSSASAGYRYSNSGQLSVVGVLRREQAYGMILLDSIGDAPGLPTIPPAEVEEWPLLAELRLGPLFSPADLSMAHNEEQDKINELVRTVNKVVDRVRGETELEGSTQAYNVTGATRRTLSTQSYTMDQLAELVVTLINDLRARGVL